MKQNILILIIAFISVFCCCGCSQHTDEQELISSKEAPVPDIQVKKGALYTTTRNELSGRLIIDFFTCIAWENSEEYVLALSDGISINAYVRYSKDLELLEEVGIQTIQDPEVDECIGKTQEDLYSKYGPFHFDAGSGLFIPSYVSNTGKVYYFIMDNGKVSRIGVQDLSQKENSAGRLSNG